MYLDDLELSMDMVSDVEAELQPFAFQLEQNYPNPFNPSTKISWQSAVSGHQTLKIYDVLGNEVATLIDEYRVAGNYEIDFDATGLSSGVYFYKLIIADYSSTKKMILMK
ncbi:MAG: T9SS type A sorting domain-containing protein [Ignavibacteriales bacterium]|nr:T9SS type A sorting domain-containing protein [Ignavibacteriales bacterium]